MKRERAVEPLSLSPETLLQRAIGSRTASSRAKYARMGLASRAPLDRTTQSMLLRQLYLAHFERQDFLKSLEIAEQMIELDTLVDVCRQDAARALVALGDVDSAVDHLRLAARGAPARRRAFHLWTLGSVLYLAGRLDEAEGALRRAVRWGTTDRPLYEAHLALIRLEAGQTVEDLAEVVERLEEAPCGQGYGRFVLGMLCMRCGRHADGEAYLRSFVKRTKEGRKAMVLSLAGEVAVAEERLVRDPRDDS
jgi:tetratricopeptide (TPR) repeat protein